MTTPATPTTLSNLTLPATSFHSMGDLGNLFTVRAGLPADVALEEASCFLSMALAAAYEAEANTVAYLVEMAKAIVDAVNSADVHERAAQKPAAGSPAPGALSGEAAR